MLDYLYRIKKKKPGQARFFFLLFQSKSKFKILNIRFTNIFYKNIIYGFFPKKKFFSLRQRRDQHNAESPTIHFFCQ